MDTRSHSHETPRRSLLLAAAGLAAFGMTPAGGAAAPWPRDAEEAARLATTLGDRLDQGVKAGELLNLHGVFVARRGKLVLERYYEGVDERWGTPVGRVAFDAGTLHDLRSVTKSIVGLLYGIALAEGKVPALDTPILDAFPAYADLAADEGRKAIRVSDVLAMTMGLDWNEDLPYSDPRNSEIAMERSPDRYRYVLSQPIVGRPGHGWRYGGGATALLGHLVARGSGMPLLEYARARLFAPLGIEQAEWTAGTNGEAAAASGLRLRPADLARIGQLLMQKGAWEGRQVVPAAWIEASLTPRATAFEGVQYGYHWYLVRRADGSMATLGMGWGGQRLVVVPALELVYVIFMGNYQRADQIRQVFAVQNLIHSAIR